MADVQNLIVRQKIACDQLARWQVNYRKDSKARKTTGYYQSLLSKIQALYERFLETHEQILEQVNEKIVELPYFTEDFDKFENLHLNFQSELEELLQGAQGVEGKQTTKTQVQTKTDELELKLPRINLPKFTGNYEDWVPFKDLFVSIIHGRASLSQVEKLHYLKCSLGGEAENLLRHFAITGANYESAWNLLNERYDNQRVLLNAQFKKLFSIGNASESATALKGLVDRTVECVQSIENLKLGDLWQYIVVYLTTQRLPQETRQLWEQNQALNTKLPSFDELKTFLNQRFRALEASGIDRSKQFRTQSHTRNVHSVQTHSSPLCVHCRGPHRLVHCAQFKQLPHPNKFDIVKRNGLCLNCLDRGHLLINCPSRFKCLKCQRSHNTLLHRDDPSANSATNLLPSTSQTEHLHVHSINTLNRREVLLATAVVTLHSPIGLVTLRALLDQGSQVSLITESAVQQLGLTRKSAKVNVSGIGTSDPTKVKGIVQISMHTRTGGVLDFDAYILDKLTNSIPNKAVLTSDWDQIKHLQLADPFFDRPCRIDVLLGADVVGNVMLGEMMKLVAGPIAQNTTLGWVISGQIENAVVSTVQSFKVETNADVEVNEQLKKFWELEEVQPNRMPTKEEEFCESFFVETTSRDKSGRYSVKLPFKSIECRNSLGSSRATALSSFSSLEKRFQKDENLKKEYTNCIQEYLDLGHMKLVSDINDHIFKGDQRQCVAHYLPHHAIQKESSTTRCRVVFDASRKTTSGISLNETLFAGPAIQNDLMTVLMKWRWHRFAFVADIAKMYRQINMHSKDAQFQRILWRSNPSEEIKDYALTTVTFGTSCAPFLAIRTLRKLAEDERFRYPNAYDSVMNEFYVDDLLSGEEDLEKTISKRKEIFELLQSGGFHLRKWISNDMRILDGVPVEDLEMKMSLDLNLDQSYKSLGIMWHPLTDQLSYRVKLSEESNAYSKRQVLSDIARLYDPLGWLSPIMITAKILLQSLWLHGLTWDEPLEDELHRTWIEFRTKLLTLGNLRIPRWVNYTKQSNLELHGFSDASSKAYAAVVYLVIRRDDEVHAHLLISKSKVAPLRTVSIPRLELCGAVLLAKLIAKVKLALNLMSISTSLWTDSEIVLAWLRDHPTRWTVFVANRTTEILNHVGNTPWRHVPSNQNPADLASRGIHASEIFDNNLWWHGPSWLIQDASNWPRSTNSWNTKLECKNTLLVHVVNECNPDLDTLLDKFSTLSRLIRVTAYCFRFFAHISKQSNYSGHLTTIELQQSFNFWLRYTQSKEFGKEISTLRNGKVIGNHSLLRNLNPFIDGTGILRIGGRLNNATLPYDAKHQIILPKRGKLVELLIHQTHQNTLHGQTQLMLNMIRRRYWILDARNTIKREIRKCVKCFRAKPQILTQLMGSLPAPRVNMSSPFTHTGVDYCGPIEYRDRRGRGYKIHKGYIAIFICLAVKAIHIEFVSDLSTAAFLAALRRFMGRRGLCNHIYSDCGTNFIGACAELRRIVKGNTHYAAEVLANENIIWHFNPPASPHFGGLWEAGVKSIKQHLRRIVGGAALTFEEMSTVLVKIEACLNSRPLYPLSDDPTDIEVLTPAHFLIGRAILTPPEQDFTAIKVNYLDRWQYVQRLTQDFWNRWKIEYLNRLQSRPKWLNKEINPRVGDICILKDERVVSYKWPLAKIIELHPGKDSLVRVVSVFSNGKIYKRPISKIALLPITTRT